MEFPVTVEEVVVGTMTAKAVILSYTPGHPGRYSGPPEYCFPEEPAEIEYELYFGEVEVDLDILTEDVKDQIEEQLLKKAEPQGEY